MSSRIEPALTAEEWADPNEVGYFDWEVGIVDVSGHRSVGPKRLPTQLIAICNAALPDSDPRKITRQKVEGLRSWITSLNNHSAFRHLAVELHHHCNALESYLPPAEVCSHGIALAQRCEQCRREHPEWTHP